MDHDRVVMLSVRADGTPDQISPELIGQVPTPTPEKKARKR